MRTHARIHWRVHINIYIHAYLKIYGVIKKKTVELKKQHLFQEIHAPDNSE